VNRYLEDQPSVYIYGDRAAVAHDPIEAWCRQSVDADKVALLVSPQLLQKQPRTGASLTETSSFIQESDEEQLCNSVAGPPCTLLNPGISQHLSATKCVRSARTGSL